MRPTVSVIVEPGTGGRFNYIITTSTGYRAIMERCDRDLCAEGALRACSRPMNGEHMHSSGAGSRSVDNWLEHSKTHCHGWHDQRVREFAAAVLKTYGSYKPVDTPARVAAALKGRPGTRWSAEQVAEALGLTVEDYQTELAKAVA